MARVYLDHNATTPLRAQARASMIAAMDVIGATVLPGASETECTSQGGRYHEFSCQWTLRE